MKKNWLNRLQNPVENIAGRYQRLNRLILHFHPSGFSRKCCFICYIVMACCSVRAKCQVVALPHAFAHNDYWHKHPLFDALGNGFTHVEADVYLWHGRLLVAHYFPLLKKHNTVEDLYLKPLYARLANQDRHQTSMDTIVLMIDIKSRGEKTYQALKQELSAFKSILSTCDSGKVTVRNLTIVLTGHRPMASLEKETARFVFVDGDLRKVDSINKAPAMYTMASCKYSRLIKWKGKGDIPAFEKARLNDLVTRAHSSGEKVRLWGSPEKEKVWVLLRNCGVDLINTNKLSALRRFFDRTTTL